MFNLIAMKSPLWLLQRKLTERVAPLETSTVTSKSRVTFVFPKKLLSLKIQWNKSKQLAELLRILWLLKPQMSVMSAMVINSTTSWTPDRVVDSEALMDSLAMTTFVIPSQRVAITIGSANRSILITFAALQIHALWTTS
jgi:hypothetical protein